MNVLCYWHPVGHLAKCDCTHKSFYISCKLKERALHVAMPDCSPLLPRCVPLLRASSHHCTLSSSPRMAAGLRLHIAADRLPPRPTLHRRSKVNRIASNASATRTRTCDVPCCHRVIAWVLCFKFKRQRVPAHLQTTGHFSTYVAVVPGRHMPAVSRFYNASAFLISSSLIKESTKALPENVRFDLHHKHDS